MSSVKGFGVDLLAVQRSLAGLQERFDDLHQQAEARFAALAAENDIQAKEKEEAQQAVEQLKQQLAVELKEKEEALKHAQYLMEQLDEKEAQARSVKEESELTLLQLHQVQEELEHYFLLSRRQEEMLLSSKNLFGRMTKVALELTQ